VKVLFVAPYIPTPGSGGRTRLINVMGRVARSHEVRLVAFAAAGQHPTDSSYPGVTVPAPGLRPRPGGSRGRARFYAERLSERLPAFASYMSSPAMARAVVETVDEFRPDVIQFETTEMAQYLPLVTGAARALDLQDVSARWIGRAGERAETLQQRALLALDLAKTKRYERRFARAAEVVFVTSAIERDFLRSLAGIEPVEAPNGVDTEAFVPMLDVAEDPKHVLFVGPLTSQANIQAMEWFVRHVLPILVRRVPDVRVDVVGTPIDVLWPSNVALLGRVEDVRAHLARAAVSVVPIRVGSGTRYKILEALSMERPVVSTTVGAEGLGVRDREHLLLADDADAFAAGVAELLDDADLRASLGRAGRAHVVERFDWGGIVAVMERAWENIVR
jgi:glycosyltransferase involved in cell wall biosynthesis